MTRRIWAVGASVRALVQSLHRGGYATCGADLFCDLDLQSACPAQRIARFPHDLLTVADAVAADPEPVDAWVYAGGLENYPEVVAAIARRIPLWGNPGPVLRRVRNVPLLAERLAAAGFAMPEMRRELPAANVEPWLRKSTRSSGGLRVAWAVNAGEALTDGEYFQRFMPGTCYGAAFVACSGTACLLGVTRQQIDAKITRAPPFHYAGSVGPIALPAPLASEVERLGHFVATEFALQGWFGVDFVVDERSRLFVLEVNPRYTASLEVLERAASVESARWHVAACGGGAVSPREAVGPQGAARTANGRLVAKAILYADRAGRVPPEVAQEWLQRAARQGDVADVPAGNSPFVAGQPLITVFASGNSLAGVEDTLRGTAGEAYERLGLPGPLAN